MSLPPFADLYAKLRISDETVQLEAKTAEAELGQSALETVSSFSNEPNRGGGYFLLGVAPSSDPTLGDYEVRGVSDPNKIQTDLATQCRTAFNISIRPIITVEQFNGKNVIVAFVPEANAHEKPVYIKALGMEDGSFRRIGSSDQHCTEEDLQLFFQLRGLKSFDAEVVEGSSLEDIDPAAINEYRRQREKQNASAAELNFPDDELLYALAATSKSDGVIRLTYCGLLCFGKDSSLRRLLPSVRVDYIRVPGKEWVQNPEERFDAIEMRGPLLTLIPRAVTLALNDLPKTFSVSEDKLFREEIPAIPATVVREAIVNALMHRSYRISQPVQIIRYANRVEIKNVGHSLVPDDRLGEPGSLARNEKIAAILHEVGLAETKGSGIRAMQRLMQSAGLSVPFFESDRANDTFTATLLTHHLLSKEDLFWLAKFKDYGLTDDELKAMVVMREMGALTSADYRRLNGVDILTANRKLRKLSDYGLFEQKGRGAQIYFKPTDRLLNPRPVDLSRPVRQEYDPSISTSREDLPLVLQELIDEINDKSPYLEVRRVIRRLCAWRPMRAVDLAGLLRRNKAALLRDFIRPMMGSGELELYYPESLSHPRQAYKTAAAYIES
jgi:ATP-dependent DNA helicase RecG